MKGGLLVMKSSLCGLEVTEPEGRRYKSRLGTRSLFFLFSHSNGVYKYVTAQAAV